MKRLDDASCRRLKREASTSKSVDTAKMDSKCLV